MHDEDGSKILRRGEMLQLRANKFGQSFRPRWKPSWFHLLHDRLLRISTTRASSSSSSSTVRHHAHVKREFTVVLTIQDLVRIEKTSAKGMVLHTSTSSFEFRVHEAHECDEWIASLEYAKVERNAIATKGRAIFSSSLSLLPASRTGLSLSQSSPSSIQFDLSLDPESNATSETLASSKLSLWISKDAVHHMSVHDLKHQAIATIERQKSQSILEKDRPDLRQCVLCLPNIVHTIWLRDEQVNVNFYLQQILGQNLQTRNPGIKLSLVPRTKMPPAVPEISILPTTTKCWSELSLRYYTVYEIQIRLDANEWTCHRRYRDFHQLHTNLLDIVPFKCPPKNLLFLTNQDSFVAQRRLDLQEYLRNLLSVPKVIENVHLLAFLGIVSADDENDQSEDQPRIHLSSLPKVAQYGDIILYKCRFGASRFQRSLTGASYDHVGIIIPLPNGQLGILEATGEGVFAYNLKGRLSAYAKEVSIKIVLRRLEMPRTSKTRKNLCALVEQIEGNPYSLSGLFKHKRKSEDVKTQKFFCSELVAVCLDAMECLDPDAPSPSSFWPGSFAQDGDIEPALASHCTLSRERVIDCRMMEIEQATRVVTLTNPTSMWAKSNSNVRSPKFLV